MPVWVKVATHGSDGLRERLMALEREHGPMSPTETTSDEQVETIDFRQREAFISIFFVVFGVVALVAGILSNVYVQLEDIFYTPT